MQDRGTRMKALLIESRRVAETFSRLVRWPHNSRARTRVQKKSPEIRPALRRLAAGIALVITLSAMVMVFARGTGAQTRPPSGEEILRRVDDNITAGNKVMTARMIIHLRRASRTVEFKSYVQGTEKAFTEYLAPPRERGTKMLKLGNQLWMYSPWTERTILISGHMLRQSVMGSDLSYEDMMEDPRLLNSYTAEVVGEETIKLGEGLKAEQAENKGNSSGTMASSRAAAQASHYQESGTGNEFTGRGPGDIQNISAEIIPGSSPRPDKNGPGDAEENAPWKTNFEETTGGEQRGGIHNKETAGEPSPPVPGSSGPRLDGEFRPEGREPGLLIDTDTRSEEGKSGAPDGQTRGQASAVGPGSEVRCWVLELQARQEDVAYPRRKLWVDRERFVTVREELYARGGTLLKKVEVLSLRKLGSRWVPDRAIFKDMLKAGEGTEFVIDSIEFDARIPDYIFTRAALK